MLARGGGIVDAFGGEIRKKGRVLRHTVLLHNLQELDNDLGRRSDQDLALASLLGVVDALESIVENGGADHLDGVVLVLKEILKSCEMRYLPTEKIDS